MDVFTEYMVKKQKSGKDVFLQILCGVIAVQSLSLRCF